MEKIDFYIIFLRRENRTRGQNHQTEIGLIRFTQSLNQHPKPQDIVSDMSLTRFPYVSHKN